MSARNRQTKLNKLADLMESHKEELATLESLDSGAVYTLALKVFQNLALFQILNSRRTLVCRLTRGDTWLDGVIKFMGKRFRSTMHGRIEILRSQNVNLLGLSVGSGYCRIG